MKSVETVLLRHDLDTEADGLAQYCRDKLTLLQENKQLNVLNIVPNLQEDPSS